MILEIAVTVILVIIASSSIILIFRDASLRKISFKEAVDLTGNPIITFYNGQRKLNFLLDTGANVSMINEADLKGCNYKETDDKRANIGIEGNQKILPIIEMDLQYKDHSYSEKLLVSDLSAAFKSVKEATGVSINGILGTSFFTKYQYVLDFDDLVAYSKRRI